MLVRDSLETPYDVFPTNGPEWVGTGYQPLPTNSSKLIINAYVKEECSEMTNHLYEGGRGRRPKSDDE